MALECLHAKQLRPKKDLYDAAKLFDAGGRSIAITSVMANVFYESSMTEHSHSVQTRTERDT